MRSSNVQKERTLAARVDLGHLARQDPLALEIERRVVAHGPGSLGQRALDRLWGTVVVVRRDPPPRGASLRELTLRFDYGRLVVHDGRVGRPDVSLWGTDTQLLSLGEVVGRTRPTAETTSAPERWWAIGRLISGVSTRSADALGLQIFGGWSHPRLVYRLALLLSPPGQPEEAALA